jgi:RNA polymerase sigma-70 factor (ECF subfamily)
MADNAPDRANPPSAAGTAPGTSLTLLQRLRDNQPEAWRTVVQLYTPLIAHWCSRGGVRGADADDVVQEVFHAAATSMDRFRREREGDSFRAWLRGITRNMLLAHFRRSDRQPRASGGTDAFVQLQEVVDPACPGPEEEDPPSELQALRLRALELVRGQVQEQTWRAFWLTAMEGQSPVDVAAGLGVSPNAIRMYKSRVLRRLKEQFGELIQ